MTLRRNLGEQVCPGAVATALWAICLAGCGGQEGDAEFSEFARHVDLTPLARVAVQDSGRLKSFDSFARGMLRFVSGPRHIKGQDEAFTYLDLMLRPEAYTDEDVIYVKKKQVRQAIVEALAAVDAVSADRLARFQETGLISQELLFHPTVLALLEKMEQDLLRTAKSVNAIRGALRTADARTLSFALRVIPPPDGGAQNEWHSVDLLTSAGQAPSDKVHAGISRTRVEGMTEEQNDRLAQSWATERSHASPPSAPRHAFRLLP